MIWNWQQKDWPHFTYDKDAMAALEERFLRQSGLLLGAYKHINAEDKETLAIDLMSEEAAKSSEIENEFLNRDSLRSSIRRQLGLKADIRKSTPAEQGIAEIMVDLYKNFVVPLDEAQLFGWHRMVSRGRGDLQEIGAYRTNAEDDPMQVISPPDYRPTIHFEAPPSRRVPGEMKEFIVWFNAGAGLPALARAGIAHLYFECIHPFEDGNGRIGRAVSEKALSQAVGEPALTALSQTIHKNKKAYYERLELNNKDSEITDWLLFFGETVLGAQQRTLQGIEFLIQKAKLYDRVRGQLNERQGRVLERMFREGPEGFKGGLSAKNYVSITGTSAATATRDLQDLVEMGAFARTGELKGTRYWLKVEGLG
jgi:Fic family protein